MTRLLHTADTHIGYRQYHRPERRADFMAAFERVVDDAIEADVDAVVHAGDLFHDRRPDLPDILGTLDALRRLAAADIPFLAVVGNHESKRDAQWLDLFESLDLAERLTDRPRVVGTGADGVALYGLDYVPRSRRAALEYAFAPVPESAATAVLVAHGQFAPLAPGTSDWDLATVLDAASVNFDAVLLGDEHTPGRTTVDGTLATYAGSTERVSAAERDDRGYNLVDVAAGEVRLSRRGLPTRPFVFVDVELGPNEGTERVREQVGQHDLEDAVVIVSVESAGTVGDRDADDPDATATGDPITPATIEEFAREHGALVARVTDRRELSTEASTAVSFADPDAAVDDRLRELGLSEAAGVVDDVVRGPVADSNVRDRVAERVEELLAESPVAFDRVADAASTDDGDGATVDDATQSGSEDHTHTDTDVDTEATADADAETEADVEATAPESGVGTETEGRDGDGDEDMDGTGAEADEETTPVQGDLGEFQ